jgi:hypothetical protein
LEAASRPVSTEEKTMSKNRYPQGWDEERVRRVLNHYEQQTDEKSVTEEEDRYDTAARTCPGNA